MERQHAEFLALALELGLIDVNAVVEWADGLIAEQERPHWSLCELATSTRAYAEDVVKLLRQTPGLFDVATARRELFSLMAKRSQVDRVAARRVAHALYQLAMSDEIDDPELKQVAWWAYDGLDLAEDGVTMETPEEVIATMVAALDAHVASRSIADNSEPA